MSEVWKPSVTVAAIVEHQGKFLIVEEHTTDGIKLNQPAGHLDPGETPQFGAAREALEESAWEVNPVGLLGIYMSRYTSSRTLEDVTYLRFALAAEVVKHHTDRALDDGIIRTLWMTVDELRATQDQHRSPLVMRCVEDFLNWKAGKQPIMPLEHVYTHPSVLAGPHAPRRIVNIMAKTVVIGMSGGVDSSVSAWLLKQQGYNVIGLFMKNWEDDDDSEYCSSRQDWLDAASVADVVGVDIEAVNFASEYKDRVFSVFLEEYSAGRTPNPDILCNSEIKFKAFLDHAYSLGADYIATGHYARVREFNGEFQLLKAVDHSKDQSYFLHRLNQAQLSKTLFPLGEIQKTEVRKIALELGLANATKKDSTGICFIGERPFREFLNRYLPTAPGPILNDEGQQIGEHVGLSFYTLGQRKGIGIGGQKEGNGEPWFVARKDLKNNTLYVVQGHNHPWLHQKVLVAEQAHYISGHAPMDTHMACKARYRQEDSSCNYQQTERGFELNFEENQFAVTPGQSAVLYQGEVCLGGGVIA